MWKKITAVMLLLITVLCTMGQAGPAYAATTIYINQQYTGTIDVGEEYVYELYIPSAGLYAIETTGSTDTYMTVDTPTQIFTDDNSGMDNNAAIGFRTTGACWVTVRIRHSNDETGTGAFSMRARKQRAQIYTFQYTDINTLEDSAVAKQKLNSMGYSTSVWEQKAASHILQTDASQYTRLNSEVVFFSGHGDPGRARFYNGSANSFLEALNFVNSGVKMTNTKVAVWLCCNGASVPSSGGYSLTTASVMMGAGAAVGWSRGIDTDAASYWAEKFFTFMAAGYGVQEAAEEAIACDPATEDYCPKGLDTIRTPQITGDKNTKLTTATVNALSVGEQDIVAYSAKLYGFTESTMAVFQEDSEQYDYVANEVYEGRMRYTKTIDGVLTNDFYDVLADGRVYHSPVNITMAEIESIRSQNENGEINFDQTIPNTLYEGYVLDNSTTNVVFYHLNGQLVPVKMVSNVYQNADGECYRKIYCMNLNDGSEIKLTDLYF